MRAFLYLLHWEIDLNYIYQPQSKGVKILSDSGHSGKLSSERILICLAIFMFAAMVGYNAFYIPGSPEVVEVSAVRNSESSSMNFGSSSAEKSKEMSEIINLNTASESELTKLHGIGPAMAKRIIEYRESFGGFSSIEEVKNVRGIGDKLFEKIKINICI